MRNPFIGMIAIAFAGSVLVPAPAATADMSQWFLSATAFHDTGTGTKLAAPDFLLSTSFTGSTRPPCTLRSAQSAPLIYGTWQLAKYDRKHHIALAYANTDEEASALFEARAPALSVPDADLSHCGTGRGLRIGSAYSQVLSTYGLPVKTGRHFVTSYDAFVPDVTLSLPHKQILDPERITLVIDNGRISSILVAIECCNG
jgi:hypothetical protein